MIGTIVNTCTIIVGSIVGAAMNWGIKEKYKDTLYTGLGLACLGHFGLNIRIKSHLNHVIQMALSVSKQRIPYFANPSQLSKSSFGSNKCALLQQKNQILSDFHAPANQ